MWYSTIVIISLANADILFEKKWRQEKCNILQQKSLSFFFIHVVF